MLFLSILLGGWMFEACSLLLPPLEPDRDEPTCTGADLDPFEGCYRNAATREYVDTTEIEPSADGSQCSGFIFSGYGSGIFETAGGLWEFNGALINNTTAGLSGSEVPNNMRLAYNSDTGQMTASIFNDDDSVRTQRVLDPHPHPCSS